MCCILVDIQTNCSWGFAKVHPKISTILHARAHSSMLSIGDAASIMEGWMWFRLTPDLFGQTLGLRRPQLRLSLLRPRSHWVNLLSCKSGGLRKHLLLGMACWRRFTLDVAHAPLSTRQPNGNGPNRSWGGYNQTKRVQEVTHGTS